MRTRTGDATSPALVWVAPVASSLRAAAQSLTPADPMTGMVVQLPSGEIVAANQMAGRLLGLEWDQLVGRTSMDPRWSAVSEVGLPLPGEQHPAMRALATGEVIRDSLMGVLLPPRVGDDTAGGTRWISIDAIPVRSGSESAGVVATFVDVSGTARAARAADALLSSYRLLSEAAPGLVLHVDTEWIIRDFADSGDPGIDSPLGRPLSDYLHPEDVTLVQRQLRNVQAGALTPVRFDCRWRCPDGRFRWMSLQATAVLDESGPAVGATVGLHDVDDIVAARRRLEELSGELDRERVRLQQAVAAARLATWEWNTRTDEFTCSDTWAQMLGYDPSELGDLSGGRRDELCHPQDRPQCAALMRELGAGSISRFDIQSRYRHANGRWVWVRDQGEVVSRDSEGVPLVVAGTREDVDARVVADQALAASEEHYRLLAEHVTDAVWRVAPDGTVVWASESTRTLLGWDPDDVVGQDALEFLPDDYRTTGLEGRAAVHAGETVVAEGPLRCSDGSYRMVNLTARPVHARDGVWEILALRDIQAEVDARTQLTHATRHDLLTGRPNRSVALEHLEQELERSSVPVVVMIVGIDGLMTVNQAWSLMAGDRLITEIGDRVADALTNSEFLARGQGDEFIVVVSGGEAAEQAAVLADRIRAAVRQPLRIGEQSVEPTVSIGIAVGRSGEEATGMLRDAGAALQAAKNNGRDRHEFSDTTVASAAQERLRIASLIRDGIKEHWFEPHYQPIVDLRTGEVSGYEALIRCSASVPELKAPDSYLPIAQASGLIVELDTIVLQHAMGLLRRMPAAQTIAVNVSASTLGNPHYVARLIDALEHWPQVAERLHIEVTETMLLSITDQLLIVVEDLAARGVRLYADDFGTGYSSITLLRDLPIDGVKLDRSFTADLTDPTGKAERLSRAMIGLAEGLGLDSVAEGVETAEQAAILKAEGWRRAQGWYYGRPVAM